VPFLIRQQPSSTRGKEIAMEEGTHTSTRSGLLGRALGLAVGAFGLSAGTAAGAGTPTTLRLYGRGAHLHSPTHEPGMVPAKGDRFTAYAELLDGPNGRTVGHFTAAFFAVESPFAGQAGSLELHTFTLQGGSIHGLGNAVAGDTSEFAVIGGTGRYAGVSGSYLARTEPRELGGAGAAEFTITLARR
jgi:hypothetical protein